MKTRTHFAKAAFTAAIIIFFAMMSPQDAFADHGRRSPVGSWIVNVDPQPPGPPPITQPFTNLATLNRDGTIVSWDPIFGGGHGAWRRTGRRGFEIKFLFLPSPDAPVPENTTVTVTAFLTVGRSGDKADGIVTAEFSNAGVVFFVEKGNVTFTRIEVDRW